MTGVSADQAFLACQCASVTKPLENISLRKTHNDKYTKTKTKDARSSKKNVKALCLTKRLESILLLCDHHHDDHHHSCTLHPIHLCAMDRCAMHGVERPVGHTELSNRGGALHPPCTTSTVEAPPCMHCRISYFDMLLKQPTRWRMICF